MGTVQSIEHTLRNLDRLAAEQRTRVSAMEKEPTDYQSQSDRPFEHDKGLQELLSRQADLAQMLDLDKGDQQAIDAETDGMNERETPGINQVAASYMRESGGALKEMAIVERNPPDTGCVSGRAVAKLDTQVAIATAANSFVVIQLNRSAGRIAVGERLTVRMQRGVATLEERIGRER